MAGQIAVRLQPVCQVYRKGDREEKRDENTPVTFCGGDRLSKGSYLVTIRALGELRTLRFILPLDQGETFRRSRSYMNERDNEKESNPR